MIPLESGTKRASLRNTGSVWKLFKSRALLAGVYLKKKNEIASTNSRLKIQYKILQDYPRDPNTGHLNNRLLIGCYLIMLNYPNNGNSPVFGS